LTLGTINHPSGCVKFKTYETKHLLDLGLTQNCFNKKQNKIYKRSKFILPKKEAIKLPEKTFVVHPYVLGSFLGDGSAEKPCITHSLNDTQTINKMVSCGYSVSNVYTHKTTGVLTTYFSKTLTEDLRTIGVFKDKHIPEEYLLGSIEQRKELIAGLIDTDGYWSKDAGQVVISFLWGVPTITS